MYEYCCLKYCCCDIVLFGSVAFSTFAVETVVACNTIAVAADVVAVVHYWRGICWCGWRALGSSIHYRRVKARYSAFSKWNIIHILISSWARTMDIGQSRVKSDLALFCDFRNWTHCYRSGTFLGVQFQKIGKFECCGCECKHFYLGWCCVCWHCWCVLVSWPVRLL